MSPPAGRKFEGVVCAGSGPHPWSGRHPSSTRHPKNLKSAHRLLTAPRLRWMNEMDLPSLQLHYAVSLIEARGGGMRCQAFFALVSSLCPHDLGIWSCEHDLTMWKMHMYLYELSRSRLSKVRALQTDTHTDRCNQTGLGVIIINHIVTNQWQLAEEL